MTQPNELTESEKQQLADLITNYEDDPDFMHQQIVGEVEDVLKERLDAVVTSLVLADLTIADVPLPSVLFHQTTVDEFKRIVAALPDVVWTPGSAGGSSEYITGDYKGIRITVWAPRTPADLRPPPQPAYVTSLLDDALKS